MNDERAIIYVIGCMIKLEPFGNFGHVAPMGFFTNKQDAFEAVVNNSCDINETIYDYAIIEEVQEGLYPCSTARWFFKFNRETKKYDFMEEPKFMNHLCGILI